MKISEVLINNYRNIQETTFKSDGTTIFIGENNCGKSNILRAITLPLYSEDNSVSKNLTWDDINTKAKDQFFTFLSTNRNQIVSGSLSKEDFFKVVPFVSIEIHLNPNANELYYVKDLSYDTDDTSIKYGLKYLFAVRSIDKLFDHIRNILSVETNEINSVKRSLLPLNMFTYSISVPNKETKLSWETLKQFKYTMLHAERDGFSSDANKIGYKALVKMLDSRYSEDDHAKIEKSYQTFFDEIKDIGNVENVINWQSSSEIPNIEQFISNISILPNMPSLSSILNSVTLGYEGNSLSMQGLGYRNLILLLVLLNSWKSPDTDTALNVLIMEEPEAHLCINNIRLMCSFINELTKNNRRVQLVFSSHSTEFINKHDLSSLIVLENGFAYAFLNELSNEDLNYLSKNPNTDIYKLFLSHRCILVEGITEELLIKAYQRSRNDLDDIDVISFHKGFIKIIDIWIKTNANSRKRLGIIRDYDDEPNAQSLHEAYNANKCICIKTTTGYTLENEIVKTENNYEILKQKYGKAFHWSNLSQDDLATDWRNRKADVMLKISQDLANGDLIDFKMPNHIQTVFDFMIGENHDN